MGNVFKGIVVGVLGFLVWLFSSVVGGTLEAFGTYSSGLRFFMYLGGILMIAGPLVYIVVIPIRNRMKK